MSAPQARAAAALALLWMLPGLFGHDPWKPDEAYTFGLVLHVLQTGDWVVPTLAGEPFVEKPPVFFVTAALFARIFGGLMPLHDAARLATLFYMSAAFAFLALATRRRYGPEAAAAAVLLLAGSIGLTDRGHQLITDTAQLAGTSMALFGFVLALERPLAAGLALGTGTGIAFLAKGLLVPGCVGVSALLLPLASPVWRTSAYVRSLAVAALAALPWITAWPLALHARSPALFDEWLWGLNVGSFIGEESIAAKPSPFFYLWVLPWFALPSWPLAAWRVWQARARLRHEADLALALVLLGVFFGVLTFSRTGRELYAMPMLLPSCFLAAPALVAAAGRLEARAWRGAAAVLVLAGALPWLVWLGLDAGVPASFQRWLVARQPAYVPQVSPGVLAVGAAYTAAVCAIVWYLRRGRVRLAAAWTGAAALAWGLSMILLLRYFDTSKSYRSMTAELSRALPAQYSCVASRGLGEPQRALLDYFAGVRTLREEAAGAWRACELLVVQGWRGAPRLPEAEFALLWEGARPGDRKELYRLYRKRRDADR